MRSRRPTTVSDVRFVFENMGKMTNRQMADALGVSPTRITKIKRELRERLKARGIEVSTTPRYGVNRAVDEFVEEELGA